MSRKFPEWSELTAETKFPQSGTVIYNLYLSAPSNPPEKINSGRRHAMERLNTLPQGLQFLFLPEAPQESYLQRPKKKNPYCFSLSHFAYLREVPLYS